MRRFHTYKGPGPRPFSGAAPTDAQHAEDAFMHLHGGAGTRLIYRLVQACSFHGRAR